MRAAPGPRYAVAPDPIQPLRCARFPGVADHDGIRLVLEHFEHGGGPGVSPAGRDLDGATDQVLGEFAGVAQVARAPRSIFEFVGTPLAKRRGPFPLPIRPRIGSIPQWSECAIQFPNDQAADPGEASRIDFTENTFLPQI